MGDTREAVIQMEDLWVAARQVRLARQALEARVAVAVETTVEAKVAIAAQMVAAAKGREMVAAAAGQEEVTATIFFKRYVFDLQKRMIQS